MHCPGGRPPLRPLRPPSVSDTTFKAQTVTLWINIPVLWLLLLLFGLLLMTPPMTLFRCIVTVASSSKENGGGVDGWCLNCLLCWIISFDPSCCSWVVSWLAGWLMLMLLLLPSSCCRFIYVNLNQLVFFCSSSYHTSSTKDVIVRGSFSCPTL